MAGHFVTGFNNNNYMSWKNQLNEILPQLGHRNWILVVDKAYPLQSAEGIITINTNEDLLYVLKFLLKKIRKEKHARPIAYTDKELLFMRDDLSKGVDSFKSNLTQMLSKTELHNIPHEEVFTKLDEASKLFNVLVLKTNCLIPYTSVFIELDCGYWTADKEATLRSRIS
jgi:D-ribose pyranose/furanose isomerase RbsD